MSKLCFTSPQRWLSIGNPWLVQKYFRSQLHRDRSTSTWTWLGVPSTLNLATISIGKRQRQSRSWRVCVKQIHPSLGCRVNVPSCGCDWLMSASTKTQPSSIARWHAMPARRRRRQRWSDQHTRLSKTKRDWSIHSLSSFPLQSIGRFMLFSYTSLMRDFIHHSPKPNLCIIKGWLFST